MGRVDCRSIIGYWLIRKFAGRGQRLRFVQLEDYDTVAVCVHLRDSRGVFVGVTIGHELSICRRFFVWICFIVG